MSAMAHPRAGQPAQPEDLIDVDAVISAYYDRTPIRRIPTSRSPSAPQGTVGRASIRRSTTRTSRPPHRRSWSTGPARASPGRCSSARTPTPCRSQPGPPRSRCCAPTGWPCSPRATTTTRPRRRCPGRSWCTTTRAAVPLGSEQGSADGIVVTPSHNPPRDGGFKYNLPHGGPADTDATSVIAARANALLADPSAIQRTAFDQVALIERFDYLGQLLRGPGERAQSGRHPRGRRAHRRRPDGRGQRAVLGATSPSTWASTSPSSTHESIRNGRS